jgi:nitrite reductase/ring-hydroxylating ferredoxin subunit
VRFVRVADLTALAAGARVVAEIDDHEILVLSFNECVYAVGNVCTHDQVWLDDGILHEDTCEIECPMHEGRFDLRTGAATHEPAEEPVPSYPVKVEGDDVFVGLP